MSTPKPAPTASKRDVRPPEPMLKPDTTRGILADLDRLRRLTQTPSSPETERDRGEGLVP
jgi:hypothetical protein